MGEPRRYRKLPVEIEAVEWTGDNLDDIESLSASGRREVFQREVFQAVGSDDVMIDTREGTMRASVGDFIIKGVAGELYPCKPAIFAATYEEVADG